MARRRWKAWAALGAAFLAFELAAPLAVALVAQCLLFGWNDAATAWWCLRRDPVRSRGWLAAGLHAASAGLKVGVGAFGCLMLIGAIAGAVGAATEVRSVIGPAEREPPAFLMAPVFLALGSMVAAWGVASVIFGAALWGRRKLWLGPEAGLARSQGVWPPWAADESRLDRPAPANRISPIIWLVIIPWITALVLATPLGLGALTNAVAGDGAATVVAVGSMVVSLVVVPFLVLRRLGGRLVASSPFEAWELEAP